MAWVIGIKGDKIAEYKQLHAAAWPQVLQMISACNIKNYSIFLREPENLLFGVFDYHGSDFDADSARMAADDATQKWWQLTDPCQDVLKSARPGEQWAPMEEVFHHD